MQRFPLHYYHKINGYHEKLFSYIKLVGNCLFRRFPFRFDTAVISGVEKIIQSIFSLTSVEHGFTISSALIGTVIGALGISKPVDNMEGVPCY